MNLVMASTPLAMAGCGHSFTDTAFVIEWHVLAMFLPSFFTGNLITRFGVLRIMSIGVLMLFASVAASLNGDTVAHFVAALVLLGLGWNFLFIGGTTLVTELHTLRKGQDPGIERSHDFRDGRPDSRNLWSGARDCGLAVLTCWCCRF